MCCCILHVSFSWQQQQKKSWLQITADPASPLDHFLCKLSHGWWAWFTQPSYNKINMNCSLHLRIGIALMVATWVSCVGLMDSKSGHSISRQGVKWPNSTYPKMSRSMFCRGIAAFKSTQQWKLVTKIKITITHDWRRSNYHLMIIIPSRVSLLHVFDFPPISAGHSSKWPRYWQRQRTMHTSPFFTGRSVKIRHEHHGKIHTCM